MKVLIVDKATDTVVKESHQSVNAPLPHKQDEIEIEGKTYLVLNRAYVTENTDSRTGLRYPEVKIFVQNLN